MHPAARLCGPGFLTRSLNEVKRFGKTVMVVQSTSRRHEPRTLLDFSDHEAVQDCKSMSDEMTGGFSTVALDHVPAVGSMPAHLRFHGSISTDLPLDNPRVLRTGFAGWRNKDLKPTIFGKTLWDLSPYSYLGFKVKTDGRKYYINIQTKSVEPNDIHQHLLRTQRPGEWETVFLRLNSLVRTNHGEVVEPQNEMLSDRITSIGMSLTDQVTGPYDLAISKVWAQIDNVEAGRCEDYFSLLEKAKS